VRGRIVALLRERDAMSATELQREVDDVRVPDLLAALVDEGLVEREGRAVRLPL